MKPCYLALDFGGTKHTAAVLLEGETSWYAHRRAPAPPDSNRSADLDLMIRLARQALDGSRPAAVGVSFGGPVNAEKGVVRLSHHVPGWENTPLRDLLQSAFHAPAQVDNDANVAAYGEFRYGAGRGLDSLCYITVSTGVGGGWILDGRIWHGVDGMAGEIGHTVVDPQGPVCLCGKRGCVERLASGPYMAGDARRRLEDYATAGEKLRKLVNGDLAAITGETLSRAAQQGDPLATEILRRGARALGVGIGNAANLVNPQCFLLGGGVTKSGGLFWDTVRETARRIALPEVRIRVEPAELGDDAPLWGAAALAREAA